MLIYSSKNSPDGEGGYDNGEGTKGGKNKRTGTLGKRRLPPKTQSVSARSLQASKMSSEEPGRAATISLAALPSRNRGAKLAQLESTLQGDGGADRALINCTGRVDWLKKFRRIYGGQN
ncbi:hypothetical protein ElyMa_004242000 [Elysia marginata]|uniref:Uncharacterized protein n=1 Tax=Elysia marginata TaxID=1093978 RepID=A0AAV4GT73_9GAST|nr:hypothetical protein ElyMa_004242000 [Elysia marginata]